MKLKSVLPVLAILLAPMASVAGLTAHVASATVSSEAPVAGASAASSGRTIFLPNLASAPRTVNPVGQAGNWKMIFDDEFNSASLDTSKWDTCYPWQAGTCTNASNSELELYNKDDVLAAPGAGLLRLRAQKRNMVGWNGQTYNFTSGMVTTGGMQGQRGPTFSFTYGYAEARVKVPVGRGLWPAFWLLPTTYAWPPEIDIMEIIGQEPTVQNMTYHWTDSGGANNYEDAGTWTGPDFTAGYHVMGVSWTRNAIVWYVDGVERYRHSQAGDIYNQPMYLLLNLAVGGSWPGAPDDACGFPAYFDVDYVRVWQPG